MSKLNVRGAARCVVGIVSARFYFVLTGGKLRGNHFIIRTPSLLRIHRGGSVSIGARTVIEKGARIVVKKHLDIGADVYIGKNATIIAYDDLVIGPRTLLAENVSIHTEDHGPAGHREEFKTASVKIGSDAWIGAGAVILRRAEIGSGATIGANAVVMREVPDGAMAAGVPAVVKRPK